jgi:DNA-binding transcriptional LysR family regulator
MPAAIADLERHDCIQFILPSTGRPLPWAFRQDGADIDQVFDSAVRCSEDVLGCVSLARAGGGLSQIYHFIAEQDVRQGSLVEVLQPFGGRARPFSILYPHNRHLSAKVRAFADFMVREIAALRRA